VVRSTATLDRRVAPVAAPWRLAQSGAIRTAPLSADQQLLDRLQAPPDLSDGVQSLGYWRQRRRRLPFYRVRARREAARMTVRWEQRVRAALVTQRRTPIVIRLSAGRLVARTRLRRWARPAAVALAAIITVALAAAPLAAAVVLLLHAL
jgi:hypothetical protein